MCFKFYIIYIYIYIYIYTIFILFFSKIAWALELKEEFSLED